MPDDAKTKRRYARIATPKNVWVAWQDQSQQGVSRVRDLNLGGLFVATPTPAPTGTVVTILLSVPEGEIRARSTVRNVTPGAGMGVEFTEMTAQDQARLQALIARLLASNRD
jgi:Tfp pilus assembly protein PilZ